MTDLEFNGIHLEYLVAKGYIHYLFVYTNEKDKSGNHIIHVVPHKTEEAALSYKEKSETAHHDYIHCLLDAPGEVVDAASGIEGKKFYILNLFAL